MAYIDDIRDGTEDDLYSRATGQSGDDHSYDSQSPPDLSPERSPVAPPAAGDILSLLYCQPNDKYRKSKLFFIVILFLRKFTLFCILDVMILSYRFSY